MKESAQTFKTLAEVAEGLRTNVGPDGQAIRRVEGRTLPKGFQWAGHDIPGRGRAAARRLRQMQKQHSA